MNIKKLLLFVFVFCIMLTSAVAQAATCTDNSDPTSATTTAAVDDGTDTSYTLGTDQKWYNLTSFTIDAQAEMEIRESVTIVNGSVVTLDWKYVTDLRVENVTNLVNLTAGNYTLTGDDDNVTWVLTDLVWNNTAVLIYYNRTINTSENLVQWATMSNKAMYTLTTVSAYGGTGNKIQLDIGTSNANGNDWDSTYFYTTRTCAARDSCEATQATVFAAFGLIALFVIVGAGMLIVSIASGTAGMEAMMGLGIASIGLAVVLFVGFIVIAQVGLSVCFV